MISLEKFKPAWRRVLLKLSGEALAGDKGVGLDFTVVGRVCDAIKVCVDSGVQVAVVIGGGNYWRGLKNGEGHMERFRADQMGMLATVMNCLAVADVLEQKGVEARVLTALAIQNAAEPYSVAEARRHLEAGRVVLLGCGTGNPYFSTDTGAVLRGAELGCEIALLAKNVDGVYTADPRKDPNARRLDRITFDQVLAQGLNVIDFTATIMARDNHLPLMVFALADPENICRVTAGEKLGTVVE